MNDNCHFYCQCAYVSSGTSRNTPPDPPLINMRYYDLLYQNYQLPRPSTLFLFPCIVSSLPLLLLLLLLLWCRTERIRWKYVVQYFLEFVFTIVVLVMCLKNFIRPSLEMIPSNPAKCVCPHPIRVACGPLCGWNEIRTCNCAVILCCVVGMSVLLLYVCIV